MTFQRGMSLRDAIRAAKKLGCEVEDRGEYFFWWNRGKPGGKTVRVKGSRHDAPMHLVDFLNDVASGDHSWQRRRNAL